jgi:hypothetical protein
MTEETQYDVFSRLKKDAQEWERHDWDDSYLSTAARGWRKQKSQPKSTRTT